MVQFGNKGQNLQKSEFLVPSMKSVAQNELKKHLSMYIFSTLGSKINEFMRKKIRKKRKNSKNLKVTGNYPNI